VDPSSYSLPYDYFYINEVSKKSHIDFYYSACNSNYEYIEKLKNSENVTLYEYAISPSEVNKVIGVINYLTMLKDIFLNRNCYIKIHFIWSIFFLIESFLFFSVKQKLIFTFHNNVPHGHNRKLYWPYKVIMKLASKIVFVSNFTMSNFIQNYGLHSNCHLIQHGVMPLDILSNTRLNNSDHVEKALAFWGRVEAYKGVDIFLDFKMVYPVEIYGKWSNQLKSLKDLLKGKEEITIVDHYLSTNELSELINRNVVFVLPYKSGTQSGVLYTLLAYGKVFISSDVGENNDFLIKHDLNKLIFDRKSESSVLEAINYAITNYKEIQCKMLVIRDEYKWEIILSNRVVSELYDE